MSIIVDKKRVVAMLLIIGGMVTAVYGASLFNQTIPSVPVQSAAAMSEGCDPTRAQNIPVENTAGALRFNCNGVTPQTFPAAINASRTGTVIATFNLNPAPTATGYSSLGLIPASVPSGPTECSSATTLVSGAPIVLAAGYYDYCAFYTTTPPAGQSFGAFQVAWSTP